MFGAVLRQNYMLTLTTAIAGETYGSTDPLQIFHSVIYFLVDFIISR